MVGSKGFWPLKTASIVIAASSLCFAGPARAEPLGSHQPLVQGSLGVRVAKIADKGFDPFASSDELIQVSVGAGATALKVGNFSLAGVGFVDYGSRGSTARGNSTELALLRLSIGPELRYHVIPQLFVFGNALPAFAHTSASLEDPIAGATRYARHWSFGCDVAAGAAYEVYGMRSGESQKPRLWIIAEGGYGYQPSTELVLRPEANSGAPERSAPIDLGTLAVGGPFARVSAAISF